MKSKDLASDWMDISLSLRQGMVHWPDDPPLHIEKYRDMERGDSCNVSNLRMGSHTGTHMDAPMHFIESGKTIDEMPFDATVGPAKVIEIQDPESIKTRELLSHSIQKGDRILFKTKNSKECWESDSFIEDFVYISHEAAVYLAERRIRTVGVDYLSVGGFKKDGIETHKALLGAGIWIIEGLNLSKVQAGDYQLVCLPLKIEKGDGAPARAMIKSI
jgi:arylformamidase